MNGFVRGAVAGGVGTWAMDLVTTGLVEGQSPETQAREHDMIAIGSRPFHVVLTIRLRPSRTTRTPPPWSALDVISSAWNEFMGPSGSIGRFGTGS